MYKPCMYMYIKYIDVLCMYMYIHIYMYTCRCTSNACTYNYIASHIHTYCGNHDYEHEKHQIKIHHIHNKNKILKITNLLVSTAARIKQLVHCSEYIHTSNGTDTLY